ncbi:MT-A70-domain-containing protein [Geopyxis carbonaria]|nr:MT-A70-domain-containing protein [Geopyxis carbonaria]
MASPLLFESITEDVALLDIPASLSTPPGKLLRSCAPLTAPHTVADPSDPAAAPAELQQNHERHAALLNDALTTLRLHGPTTYCRPRCIDPPPEGELALTSDHTKLLSLSPTTAPPLLLTDAATELSDLSDIFARPVSNPHSVWKTLTLRHPAPAKTFHIPPLSSFLLAPVTPATPLPLQPEGGFDFILLDPPWPNRSASRAGAYNTVDRRDVVPMLKALRIREALAPGGIVGVWVTNRPALQRALREEVLPAWGCGEGVEWVWVKVTSTGEPVLAMEGRMRKPYEVLVLARRTDAGDAGGASGIARKVIVAVPDLHSRKPCIKDLIEHYLPTPYRAAELYGRNLTEGWTTWGDEAVRFNWDGHWVEKMPPTPPPVGEGGRVRLTFS